MKTYEIAAVKMAVKRSNKAGTFERGFQSIEQWRQNWDAKGISVNYEVVLKCFKKWARREF